MFKKRNLLFLSLLILGVLLVSSCTPKLPFMVIFDSQGGSAVDSQMVEYGGLITEPTSPTKTGFTFGGWYKEPGCTNPWDFDSDIVIADVTLYAQWITPGYNIHNVTQDVYYTAIQASLDAADSGDIIEVADGTYAESVTLPDSKLIILRSLNGASSTTIIGDDNSTTVTSNNCPNGTTLEGFTITHNSGNNRGGVTIYAGYLAINNCTISNNSNAYAGGGIFNLGTLTITDSTISGNSAPTGGGIVNGGTLTITGSTISNNSGSGISNDGTLTITGSTISNNSGSGIGNGGTLTITGSTISGNSADVGGGIWNNSGGTITITGSTISGNSANTGGGILSHGTLTITGSTISNNDADLSSAGGIFNGGTLNITDSIISDNSATSEGGGIFNYFATISITGSTISGNSANTGGGIYLYGEGTITIGGNSASNTVNFNNFIDNFKEGSAPSANQHISNGSGDCHTSYPNNYFTPDP